MKIIYDFEEKIKSFEKRRKKERILWILLITLFVFVYIVSVLSNTYPQFSWLFLVIFFFMGIIYLFIPKFQLKAKEQILFNLFKGYYLLKDYNNHFTDDRKRRKSISYFRKAHRVILAHKSLFPKESSFDYIKYYLNFLNEISNTMKEKLLKIPQKTGETDMGVYETLNNIVDIFKKISLETIDKTPLESKKRRIWDKFGKTIILFIKENSKQVFTQQTVFYLCLFIIVFIFLKTLIPITWYLSFAIASGIVILIKKLSV